MKNTTMNLANSLPRTNREETPSPKIKKIALAIEVGHSNLAHEVKRMFDLAKSSGQELDLTFSHHQMQTA